MAACATATGGLLLVGVLAGAAFALAVQMFRNNSEAPPKPASREGASEPHEVEA